MAPHVQEVPGKKGHIKYGCLLDALPPSRVIIGLMPRISLFEDMSVHLFCMYYNTACKL